MKTAACHGALGLTCEVVGPQMHTPVLHAGFKSKDSGRLGNRLGFASGNPAVPAAHASIPGPSPRGMWPSYPVLMGRSAYSRQALLS